MAESQTRMKKGGKNMTTSNARKAHYSFYKNNVYTKHKLMRIIKSCGEKFARKWAYDHSALGVLATLLN
jgi:hypothetical protein